MAAKKPKQKLEPKKDSLAERLSYTIEEASRVSSLGQTSLYQAIKDKDLIAKKYGARTLITRTALLEFLDSLPTSTA